MGYLACFMLGSIAGAAVALHQEQSIALLRRARDRIASLFHRGPKE